MCRRAITRGALFAGVGVITGGSGHADNLHILQFGRHDGFTALLIIRNKDRDNIAGFELAGKAGGEALDRNTHGLLGPVQIVKVRVFGGRRVGDLGR
ncbi:hypothetical protein SDC9_166197 [bioreactor metagenome]|uniref:Uncharacterized protein n=1 Tax=bioreactor metagenome TaxID=1076179 RepID=A0A645FYP6_9ZZZZ